MAGQPQPAGAATAAKAGPRSGAGAGIAQRDDTSMLNMPQCLFTLFRHEVDAGVGEFVIAVGNAAHSFDASEVASDGVTGAASR